MRTVQQLRGARAMLGWTQEMLAERSGISPATIRRMETADGDLAGYTKTVDALRRALEAAGALFIDADASAGPGVRLALDAGKRPAGKRAKRGG
jgi:predicted transcriptional regulator